MTDEADSLANDPQQLLTRLRGHVSERKHRLFNVACCRRLWPLYRKPEVRFAILVGEAYADGHADKEQLRAALRTIHQERARTPTFTAAAAAIQAAGFTVAWLPSEFFSQALPDMTRALGHPLGRQVTEEERRAHQDQAARAQCTLLLEFFADSFLPVRLDPSWRAPSVQGLASAVYEDHSFDHLPILADALEDAGCDEPLLLGHLRGPGPHYRGCWALDLLLERA